MVKTTKKMIASSKLMTNHRVNALTAKKTVWERNAQEAVPNAALKDNQENVSTKMLIVLLNDQTGRNAGVLMKVLIALLNGRNASALTTRDNVLVANPFAKILIEMRTHPL